MSERGFDHVLVGVVALIVGALVTLLIIGIVGGLSSSHTVVKTKTVTTPPALIPKPGAVPPPVKQSAPSCTAQEQKEIEAGKGSLGDCTPGAVTGASTNAPVSPTQVADFFVAANTGQTGPDVSNNDPFYNWHPVKSHGHPFGYLKINQGTRFVDSTAAGMARGARAAGVIPGGYDFLEVCRVSASAEGALFSSRVNALGLVKGAMVPVGDAEWPLNAPCSAASARAWLDAWASTVHSHTGRWPGFYTGAWWANPNIGCWRPPGGAPRWISGYTFRRNLAIPCGWGGVDLWQFTDHGYNGLTYTDMSALEVPLSHFTGSTGPTPAQKRAAKRASLKAHKALIATLHTLIGRHRCRKGQHAAPPSYHTVCGRWVRNGKIAHAVAARLERELAT